MAEQPKDKVYSINLTASELFQLHLCIITRIGFTTAKWTVATSEAEQKGTEAQTSYLNGLAEKIKSYLDEIAKEKGE